MSRHRLTLKHTFALGDTVMFTALVRDIHAAYPEQFEISVQSHFTPVWWHNPRISQAPEPNGDKSQLVEVKWGEAIDWHSQAQLPQGKKELKHILSWYHYDFERKTGLKVPVTQPKGELFLQPSEERPIIEGRYWVVVAGGKKDATVKHWHPQRYQEVVDRLSSYGLKFVQIGATHRDHVHPVLDGCRNMIGKTDNPRDLFNLIRHAEGVICPVTAAMHIAAVFDKPCVVLAGAREEPWFEWYGDGFQAFGPKCASVAVPHKFLHTVDLLWCCKGQGCWSNRVVPLEPADTTDPKKRRTLCKLPLRQPEGHAIASCMDLIQVDHVVEAVMEYYDSKILPPIGTPKGSPLLPSKAEVQPPSEDPQWPPAADFLPSSFVEDLGLVEPPTVPPLTPQIASALEKALARTPTVDVVGPPDFAKALPGLARAPSEPAKHQPAIQQRLPPEFHRVAPGGLQPHVLDHPVLGGKITVCVLCYGPYTELAKRCLGSILGSVPRQRMDLRIATNAAAKDTVEYVTSLEPDRLYINSENRKKYPVMREMFHDPECPLRTPYLVWFDDDAYVVDPKWLQRLGETIIANHGQGCRLYGTRLFHDLSMYLKGGHRPDTWFRTAPWHRGVGFHARGNDKPIPNGSCVSFVPGWFWAIATETIKRGDIPDTRLQHNGGDITIGAQVAQLGGKIKEFNKGKVFVYTPTKEQGGRRDYEESFPWVNPEAKFAREYHPPR